MDLFYGHRTALLKITTLFHASPFHLHPRSFPYKPKNVVPFALSDTGPVLNTNHLSFNDFMTSSGVEDAKKALVAACGTAEKSATVAASLPRFLAQSTSDELNNAIRESLEASHEALNIV